MYNNFWLCFGRFWNNFQFDVDYAVVIMLQPSRRSPTGTGLETWIWRVRKVTDAHYNVKPQLILYYNYFVLKMWLKFHQISHYKLYHVIHICRVNYVNFSFLRILGIQPTYINFFHLNYHNSSKRKLCKIIKF